MRNYKPLSPLDSSPNTGEHFLYELIITKKAEIAMKRNKDAKTPRQARHISQVLSKNTAPISGNIEIHNNLTIILLVLAKSRIARSEKPSNVLFCTKRYNIATGITSPMSIPNQSVSSFCFILFAEFNCLICCHIKLQWHNGDITIFDSTLVGIHIIVV